MSPHLPLTPDQIVADALGAAEAGAAILHLHARDPKDGRPTPDPGVFLPILERLGQSTDAEAREILRLMGGDNVGF